MTKQTAVEPPELLPCPFCGQVPAKYRCPQRSSFHSQRLEHFNVFCQCGAQGGDAPTSNKAISAWNTRTSSPSAVWDEAIRIVEGFNGYRHAHKYALDALKAAKSTSTPATGADVDVVRRIIEDVLTADEWGALVSESTKSVLATRLAPPPATTQRPVADWDEVIKTVRQSVDLEEAIVKLQILSVATREPAAEQWQDIASAPKDGTKIFCCWPFWNNGEWPVLTEWRNGHWLADEIRDYTGARQPTHWMPLPSGPQENQRERP